VRSRKAFVRSQKAFVRSRKGFLKICKENNCHLYIGDSFNRPEVSLMSFFGICHNIDDISGFFRDVPIQRCECADAFADRAIISMIYLAFSEMCRYKGANVRMPSGDTV
jgi:hypothetical protein